MGSTLRASSTPSATPASTPTQPTISPCVMNTRATRPGDAPSVRRMAMSVRLSDTTITSMATMLKAATPTTSSRISAIIVFSMRMARK